MTCKQKTLKAPLTFQGKGLHTGIDVTMRVCPAEAGHGIRFRRTDLEGQPEIDALADHVLDTSRGTTIGNDKLKISTIEHIMAALWGSGIDNALIEIDGPEVPIMDGSAREYVARLAETGLEEQDAERVYYNVSEKTSFTIPEKGVSLTIYPDDEFSISVHIDYNSKVLGNQYAVLDECGAFAEQVAPCRTFVFLHELEPLIKLNLIKGGDLDNAIVVVEKAPEAAEMARLSELFGRKDIEVTTSGYLNNLELRFPNEPARHKLLDIVGDLALIGTRIRGRVVATRPGHFANTELARIVKKNIRRDAGKPRFTYDPAEAPVYDINQIRRMLPHRPPFLLIDKIIHVDPSTVVGIKNVTMNEPFFVGHFPDEPVMPGVLIIEAMAQCGGILALSSVPDPENYSTYFLKIDGVRFKQKVVPGDTLMFELTLAAPIRRGVVLMDAKAYVGGRLTTEGQLMAQIAKNK
ncbi:MAG: bifunctional UDP-3-O-[Rikenellaceae bacterium]|nr:bifunctional UDP-3-O-[3-hydroxymyristoyl] N-acetylglucosamine deacetylase/3-hydroxyacyl-ACP dehydratase [Rikenellaceae bacterium]